MVVVRVVCSVGEWFSVVLVGWVVKVFLSVIIGIGSVGSMLFLVMVFLCISVLGVLSWFCIVFIFSRMADVL